jgi:hypothetical protein
MSWSDGYVTEIDYTPGYIQEMNPHRAAFAALLSGYASPKVETACELGFGMGVTFATHAAASDIQWYGCDFKPSHAANAQRLLAASGARSNAIGQSFAEFCSRDDLPDFDFIGLHGVYSWIDPANRQIIADFLQRKLRVGGMAYISYNCQPGWTAFAPIRQLIAQYVNRLSAPGMGMVARMEAALAHVDALIEAEPAYFKNIPLALERYKMMRGLDRRYLIHEIMTDHWAPLHFADVARTMEAARLTYAGSAHPIDHVDAMNLTAPQAKMLLGTNDVVHKETLRDLFTNQQFRRDLWVKGAQRLDPRTRALKMAELRLTPLKPRADLRLKARAARGDVSLKEDNFAPLLDMISAKPGVLAAELSVVARARGLNFDHMMEAIALFIANGDVAIAQAPSEAVKAQAQRYNASLARFDALSTRDDLMQLACPLSGGGAAVTRAQLLLLDARAAGAATPAAQIEAALVRVRGGAALSRDGAIEGERGALQRAHGEIEERMGLWQALGALPATPAAPAADATPPQAAEAEAAA